MNFNKFCLIGMFIFLSACTNMSEYGETVKNTAGGTCTNGVGGCTPDEDRSGDFVNY